MGGCWPWTRSWLRRRTKLVAAVGNVNVNYNQGATKPASSPASNGHLVRPPSAGSHIGPPPVCNQAVQLQQLPAQSGPQAGKRPSNNPTQALPQLRSSAASTMASTTSSQNPPVGEIPSPTVGHSFRAWQEALDRCRSLLGEADFERVSQYVPENLTEGLRTLQQHDAEKTINRVVSAVQPCLGRVQHFTALLAIGQLQNNLNLLPNVFLWGTFHLMIEVKSRFYPRRGFKITNTYYS